MYDRKHVLLTWGGPLPGGESWSCGIRLASRVSEAELSPLPLGISDELLQELLTSYTVAVKAFHARSTTGIHPTVQLTRVKAAAIGTNGKYLNGQVAMFQSDFAPVYGAGAANIYPNQTALAVTTTTDVKRGLAKMGRFYLPMVSFGLTADGGFSPANAIGCAGSAKTFIEAISDVPGVDVITSPGASVMSKVGAGATNRITGVKVGRIFDTQRRRRRSLPEAYSATTVDQGVA